MSSEPNNTNNEQNLSGLSSYPAPASGLQISKSSSALKQYYRNQTELVLAYQELHHSANDDFVVDGGNDRTGTTSDNGDGNAAEHIEMRPIERTSQSPTPQISVPERTAGWTIRRQAQASMLANFLLGGCKAAAVALSGSLVVVASLIESSLQFLSGFVVWRASHKTRRRCRYSYPQGRTRLEPVAIVVLAVVTAVATVQMLVRVGTEAFIALAQCGADQEDHFGLRVECLCSGGYDSVNGSRQWTETLNSRIMKTIGVSDLTPTVIALVSVSVVVKAVLLFACLVSSDTRNSHSGRVLALAHFNDIVCSSLALAAAAAARYLWPYLDPIGAAVIVVYIMVSWGRILIGQIRLLTGRCADHHLLQLLIFASVNHSPLITGVCSVTAFHHGVQCLAEVSVQLAAETPLCLAHDVAESLQRRLERIEGVERAFVHPHCGERPCEHKIV